MRAEPFVIGRKAWLFSNISGATACAIIYNLVDITKVNGQEPYTRPRHVLKRLPHAYSVVDTRPCSPGTAREDTMVNRQAILEHVGLWIAYDQ